jgi:GntR family transcriptional regulator
MNIDTASSVPVYKQAVQAVKVEILSGRLKNGDTLPPIRELAKIIKLHPNTVAKVYAALQDEGFIEGKVGSGYWVTYKGKKPDGLKKALMEDEFKNFVDRVVAIGATKADIKELVNKYLNGDEQ